MGCHNKLMAFVDGNSGRVNRTVPIGQGVDANRFDPGTGFAFASCGDGTLTVAHEDAPDTLSLVETITTQRGARTMALDKSNHNVYLVYCGVRNNTCGNAWRFSCLSLSSFSSSFTYRPMVSASALYS